MKKTLKINSEEFLMDEKNLELKKLISSIDDKIELLFSDKDAYKHFELENKTLIPITNKGVQLRDKILSLGLTLNK